MEQRLHVVHEHQMLAQIANGEGGVGKKGKNHSGEKSSGFRIRPSGLVFGLC